MVTTTKPHVHVDWASTTRRVLAWCAPVLVCLIVGAPAGAQELEPGAYWPIPAGFNIVTVASTVSWGDVNFDPTLPIDDASATLGTTALAFTRAFDLAGRSANIGVASPVIGGKVAGNYLNQPTQIERFGLGDPRIRFAVNLYGAPAMTPREFATYRQRLIVGVSLTAAPPLGQYDNQRLINLGSNRWSFKPEIGLSRQYGQWVLETMVGAWFFTDNDDFYGGRTRSQKPIQVTQVHLTHRWPGMWLSGNANFYVGGRTSIDGAPNLDLQKNSRMGLTFSKAIKRGHSIRASVSRGAYTTIGADFNAFGVAYNYAWAKQPQRPNNP
jgi:hypothetical protein